MFPSRQKFGLLIFALSTFFFIWLAALNLKYIDERLETLTLVYRFQLRNLIITPPVPENIVIVAIDEKSLSGFGRWPWSRTLQARLIKEIMDKTPKVLAIDIMYSEKEDDRSDAQMAKSLEQYKDKIVLALGFNVPVGKAEKAGAEPPDYVLDHAFQKVKDTKLGEPIKADRIIPPIEKIGQNTHLGHVYNMKDIDGKTLWEVLYIKYADEYYPSLSLQTARIALNIRHEDATLYMGRGISIGNRTILFDPYGGKMLINYLGKEMSFRHISASDILNKRIDRSSIENKIVFLGTTAIATYDIINTPFSANMPGVEKNATVVENIINSRFIKRTPRVLDIAIILITGIIFGIVYSRMKALKASLLSLGTIFMYIALAQALFTYNNLWMNLIYPVSNMLVIFIGTTATKYFFEEKKAREIRSMFSCYVSPKIVEELINNPEKAKLGGEKKSVTVLFSDIQGFTSISERNPPEKVVSSLNEYFTVMTDIIFKWDGTLDKFVGDEIMAFWGAPGDQPNHAELAVRCALDMMDRLSEMQKKWREHRAEVLDCGIGINTGEVIVGNIGAVGKKMDYTVIGDHVNIAARVEKLTRQYNAKIIVTEYTIEHLKDLIDNNLIGHVQIELSDTVKVKGKEKGIRIYEIKGLRPERH